MWRARERKMPAEGLDPDGMGVEVAWDMADALEAYNRRELFGLPKSGGADDQEVWWEEAVMVVLRAKHAADEQHRQDKDPSPCLSGGPEDFGETRLR